MTDTGNIIGGAVALGVGLAVIDRISRRHPLQRRRVNRRRRKK